MRLKDPSKYADYGLHVSKQFFFCYDPVQGVQDNKTIEGVCWRWTSLHIFRGGSRVSGKGGLKKFLSGSPVRITKWSDFVSGVLRPPPPPPRKFWNIKPQILHSEGILNNFSTIFENCNFLKRDPCSQGPPGSAIACNWSY